MATLQHTKNFDVVAAPNDQNVALLTHAADYNSSIKKPTFSKQLVSDTVFRPAFCVLVLLVYFLVLGFLSLGQQHMDFGIDIGAWAVLVTLGQIGATLACGYYWRQLYKKRSEWRSEILLLTTTTMAYLFLVSNNVYFVLSYAALYNTQTTVNSFSQRQFDAIFILSALSIVVIVPRCIMFMLEFWNVNKVDAT